MARLVSRFGFSRVRFSENAICRPTLVSYHREKIKEARADRVVVVIVMKAVAETVVVVNAAEIAEAVEIVADAAEKVEAALAHVVEEDR
jgi:hypothetical protein